ncbi:hypothetical protein L7F22_034194 [Adiantum nelumboides]|nr:hypothetical protein [Adiantum nelumboides]
MQHIKAIITAEEVLLRNPSYSNVIPVVQELCRRLPIKQIGSLTDNGIAEESGNEPQKLRQASKSRPSGTQDIEQDPAFEFRALEVALEAICSFLDARTTELGSDVHPAFDELTAKISSRNLDKVRKLKTAMTRLTTRVQKVRDELEQLLDDDSDMAELFLTRKLQSLASPEHGQAPLSLSAGFSTTLSRASRASIATCGADDDVEEVERLLEAYFMRIDDTLNKLLALREYIDDTEDYINFQLQLDKHRNRLIQLELVLNAGAVVLSVYAAVAGIFGMNVQYTWMIGHSHVFKWVVLLSGLVSLILFALILSYARLSWRGFEGRHGSWLRTPCPPQQPQCALQLEYLHLYLIHWPVRVKEGAALHPKPDEPMKMDLQDTWTRALKACVRQGLVRAIGVSNFSLKKIMEMLEFVEFPPAVNQVEVHPKWQQRSLRETLDSSRRRTLMVASFAVRYLAPTEVSKICGMESSTAVR